MQSGVICAWTGERREFVDLVQLADELGYQLIGVSDSIFRDTYVSLALAAVETQRALLGPMVTNPVTRHPAVTAAAISSIDELSSGRAFLGVGSGDSAVRSLSRSPATVAALEECVRAVGRLTEGLPAQVGEAAVQHRWARRRVPVFVTAEGSRTLQMAGRVADSVVLHTGNDPQVIAESVRHVHRGAKEAGRDPAAIAIWSFIKLGIADSRAEAVDGIKMSLAASVNHAFRYTLEGKHVPPEHVPGVQELIRRYRTSAHVEADGANHALTDELGLTDYLADRFGVVGTAGECVAQIRALEAAGVDGVVFGAFGRDPISLVRRFGDEVLPHL